MKYFERLALALFLVLPFCCASPRGRPSKGSPPAHMPSPGRWCCSVPLVPG